jgi:phage gpG-like protein
LTIEALRDLTPIFARFLKWLRPEIDKVFEQQGPGWPSLKEDSAKQRAATIPAKSAIIRAKALNPLARSVLRTYGRAEKRLGRTAATSPLLARRQKTVAKQREQAEEIGNILLGRGQTFGKAQFDKLHKRVDKYKAKAEDRIKKLENGELLGRIASSIRAEIEKGTLIIESGIEWAGIHNDGGTAGNGARIPKRTFLEWTPERIEKFIEIAQQYVIEKLTKDDARRSDSH